MAPDSLSDPPPPPQWVVNLENPIRPKAKITNLANPPGYTEASSGKVETFYNLSYISPPLNNGMCSVLLPHPKLRPANPQLPPKPTS